MTLYVYRSQNSNHLNRPVKTRLLISVRFVPTVTESLAQPQTNIVSGVLLNPGAQHAQSDAETGQSTVSPTDPGDLRGLQGLQDLQDLQDLQLSRASLRGAMSMRLRLVAPDASTKKEYHHAKSLLA